MMTILRPGGAPIYFLTFCDKTSFFKLQDIYPECFFNREKSPQVEPMMCVQNDSCPVNHNCMEILAKRTYVLFQEVLPEVQLIVLYYRKRNISGIGATLFWRDMTEPRNITVNPYGWSVIKSRGTIYEFSPGPNFFLTGRVKEPEVTTEESAVAALD
jgi:hypothetical protein